jgi:ABC-type transport system involved in multi-copper enzyme maturation permease subunit
LTYDDRRFHALIYAQAIAQMILFIAFAINDLLYLMNDIISKFPLFWACIMAMAFAAPAFSSEKENGMIELLKLSRIDTKGLLLSKLLLCMLFYPIFLIIYLPAVYLASAYTGMLTFWSALVLVTGPYFAVYILICLLMFLLSVLSKKNVYPIFIGCSITAYVVFLDSIIAKALGWERWNPMHHISKEFILIRTGSYPDPMFWTWFIFVAIILSIVLALVVRMTMKGVRR